MSGPWAEPWSHNPNAPQIDYEVYVLEKINLASTPIGAVLYGITIILFFQCMGALLHPVNRTKGGVKWALVAHTAAMFSLATINAAMGLNPLSVSYIEGREFPRYYSGLPPGPLGYQSSVYYKPISTVPSITFPLNQWLADGFLLYRCYVIYATNYWVIAFPSLMYLASMAMGIADIYEFTQPDVFSNYIALFEFDTSYYSISLALNVLLTLMIIMRLVLHNRNVQNAIGAPAATSRTYKAIITMLVESFAVYAIAFLVFIALHVTNTNGVTIFSAITSMVQVIAPFLLILRVANRRALTSDDITSGNGSFGSMQFRRSEGESTSGDEITSDENPAGSYHADGQAPGVLGGGAENAIDEVPR